ncbi:hypothetical protein EC912_101547 [Luteibacter rhizovicinus]|uniref:Sulfite dehydrogenase (Cytochrome) subunit SorB n=1 Tax=Luteibacter rhizovicinus TaxID=242606 RepID=A0A4R3YXR3_9GAMM|nr:hypothetical protein [Luteibacter rhizovicinus]TCV97531.1 hypothetical protein EC912_101547 [Luteibacter rhizovicinus]
MRNIAIVVLCFSFAGMAAAMDVKLPAETAKLRASTLPGYAIATRTCGICHSLDYVAYQPPGMSQAQWTAEVTKMQRVYGAPIGDDDVKLVGAYLSAVYGSEEGTDGGTTSGQSAQDISTTKRSP